MSAVSLGVGGSSQMNVRDATLGSVGARCVARRMVVGGTNLTDGFEVVVVGVVGVEGRWRWNLRSELGVVSGAMDVVDDVVACCGAVFVAMVVVMLGMVEL